MLFMCFPEDAVSKRAGAGLLRSTREWMEMFLDAGAVFLLTRDFFSISMMLLLVEGLSLTTPLTKAQRPGKKGQLAINKMG
jgi:hypothetical protein